MTEAVERCPDLVRLIDQVLLAYEGWRVRAVVLEALANRPLSNKPTIVAECVSIRTQILETWIEVMFGLAENRGVVAGRK